MFSTLLSASLLATTVFSAETITIRSGSVTGSTSGNVDSYKGIPFGQAERLKKAVPVESIGKFDGTQTPLVCPQLKSSSGEPSALADLLSPITSNPLLASLLNINSRPQGENCLTLNVQRPKTATANSKLPVLLWIHGGGYASGNAQEFDGSPIIDKSISLQKDIIYVAVQYRLSAFGFLGGKELQQEGNTNLGIRDQRLAMQWVQDNIAAFGGDPSKTTIWGQSAGSLSVFNHLLVNKGDNSYGKGKLFRSAILSSGMQFPASSIDSPAAQMRFNQVLESTGCAGQSDSINCLRTLDFDTFYAASNMASGGGDRQGVHVSDLPRPDPTNNFLPNDQYKAIASGEFTKVPVIATTQEDDGALFALGATNVTTTRDLVDYLQVWFPTAPRSSIQEYVNSYPEDITEGAPFRTGILYNFYGQCKRLAAIQTDYAFTLSHRISLRSMAPRLPAIYDGYYTSNHIVPALGTFHGTDILCAYQGVCPPAIRESLLTYYISFVNELDPNVLGSKAGLITWPKYSESSPILVEFGLTGTSLRSDDFRPKQFAAQLKFKDIFKF